MKCGHVSGDFAQRGTCAHIRRCHVVFVGWRERLLPHIAGDLSPWLKAIPTAVGFHLSAWLKRDTDIDLLCRLARRVEVGIYPSAGRFADRPDRQGLLFGFGAIDSIDIDAALGRLRDIFIALEQGA